jgi:hypothetical protein
VRVLQAHPIDFIAFTVVGGVATGGAVLGLILFNNLWGAALGAGAVTLLFYAALGLLGILRVENPTEVVEATVMISFLAGSFSFIWGVGAVSPGASAHEGPTSYSIVSANEDPGTLGRSVKNQFQFVSNFVKWVVPQVVPLIRPLLITLGIVAIATIAIVLISSNPVVRIARDQTSLVDASATDLSTNKLVTFVILVAIVLGSVAAVGIGLALLMTSVSRQVEVSTKKKQTSIPNNWSIKRIGEGFSRFLTFVLDWVVDMLDRFTKSATR